MRISTGLPKLSAAEKMLISAAAVDAEAELRPQRNGQQPVIRAEVPARLVHRRETGVAGRGRIRMVGGHVRGPLDLSGAHLMHALCFTRCVFEDRVDLTRVRADKPVEWNGGQIGSILADHFSSATDLVIRNATVTGLVSLWSAWVRGDVRLSDSQLSPRSGQAIRADHMRVGGTVFMNGENFHARGEVCLRAARIEGQLNCRHASFSNASGYSISADHIVVGGDVLLEEGFCADGEVCVQWARVGRLRATGGSFASATTYALHADTLHADGGADPNLRPFRFPAAYPAHQIGASPAGTIITSQRSSSQAKAAPIGTYTRASPACSPNRVGRLFCLSYSRRYTFNYNPNGRPAPQVIARVSTIVTVIPFCGEGWGNHVRRIKVGSVSLLPMRAVASSTHGDATSTPGGEGVRPTVVYIHGNGNKARKETLKAEWDMALFGTDMGAHSIMAYWAALRYPEPLPDAAFDEIEHAEAIGPERREGVEPTGIDPTELLAETLAEVDGARTRAPAEVVEAAEGPEDVADASAGLDAWLLRMAYTAEAVVAGEGPPGLEVLPLPRAARIATFRALLKITFKDVYAYFFGGFREPMRAVLREALTVAPDPVVVISHSLGTIIAYDVLREAAFTARGIPLFVTAGSPLGVTEVQDLVVHDLEVPAGVAAWRNIADARDLVALDPTLRPEYAPKERCADFLVVNDSANHHGIREYLSSRPVQESVRGLFA